MKDRTFSRALQVLHAGQPVRRGCWAGTCCEVLLTEKAAFHRGEGDVAELNPMLVGRTVDGSFVAWNPTQADILADDWELGPTATLTSFDEEEQDDEDNEDESDLN